MHVPCRRAAHPPVELGGRLLLDGGLVNVLPVDIAAMAEPDVVVAVSVRARREREMPSLHRWIAGAGWGIGRLFPNPVTARLSFELLVRAGEIALDRQATLAAGMVGPEVLVEPDVRDLGLRDFHKLDDAVDAGRRATEAALPAIRRAMERASATRRERPENRGELTYDPICEMVVTPSSAVAVIELDERKYYFCSLGCRDAFAREHAKGA